MVPGAHVIEKMQNVVWGQCFGSEFNGLLDSDTNSEIQIRIRVGIYETIKISFLKRSLIKYFSRQQFGNKTFNKKQLGKAKLSS